MRPLVLRILIGASAAIASSVGAAQSYSVAALFPQSAAAPVVTPGGVVLHPSTKASIKLTPVRFVPRPGLSQYRDTHFCGVVLENQNGARQGVVTLGMGYTETLMCAGLAAAGVVPPARSGVWRIGLIYDTGTLRSALRTPVVLVVDPATARWSVDEATTAAMDSGRPARTIAQLRRKLATRGRR